MIINQTNQNIQPFEDMVDVVNNHPYPLLKQQTFVYRAKSRQIQAPYFNNLGDLQQTLDVYVVDMDSLPCKELTISDIGQHINSLIKEQAELRKALEINRDQPKLWRKYELTGVVLTSLRRELENNPNSNGSITLNITIKGLYHRNSNGKGEILIGYNRLDTTDMVLTYIHEMMHAYFDASLLAQPHVEYAEEPLAELGKLRFCEDFDCSHNNFTLYQAARQNVQSKQFTLGMGHYGFGLFLKDNYDNFPLENIFRANHHLLLHNKLYQVLESLSIFPWEEAEAHWLSNLLLKYILNSKVSAIPVAKPNVSYGGRIVYPYPSYFDNNRLSNGNIERPDVITPEVVKYLVDQIPIKYLERRDSTFFDPFEKDSPFLEEIAARLMTTMQAYFPNEADREKHIRKNMLFGYDGKDSTAFLYAKKKERSQTTIFEFEYDYEDSILSDDMTTIEKHLWSRPYSVIIGVPPFYYRTGTTKICLYLPVIEKILHICRANQMLFLTPTNWYMCQNNTCRYYRSWYISPHLEALYDFYQTKDVFPHENFLGGVAAMGLGLYSNHRYSRYYYTEIPKFPYYNNSEYRHDDYILRGITYNHIYKTILRSCYNPRTRYYMSIERGGYSSWSIKNVKHPSKGYIIQHHTPGQAVPPSNYVVCFDSLEFNPQAVEKFFQTKIVRYLVYHGCPTTSRVIPKYAFDILPIVLLSRSDIDWSLPIDQIEDYIYQGYYSFTQDEIDTINREIH